jgi:hypothetical protein
MTSRKQAAVVCAAKKDHNFKDEAASSSCDLIFLTVDFRIFDVMIKLHNNSKKARIR